MIFSGNLHGDHTPEELSNRDFSGCRVSVPAVSPSADESRAALL